MHAFSSWLLSLGITPPEVYTGKWQRTSTVTHPRKKNAAIKLDDNGQWGCAIDHASMTEAQVWRIDAENRVDRSHEDNALLAEKLRKRREEEQQGIMRARTIYTKAEPLKHANHEYLRAKRLDMNGCAGLKVDADGWLVVPMWIEHQLRSVQRISPTGEKRFVFGAPTKWATFRIWRPAPAMTVLCEGLATGLAIFAALPNAVVDVCFSAGNLVAVAERGDWKGLVAVACDNDHWTQEIHGKNPGVEAGQRAAKAIGCGVAIPQCSGTDWHDFFIERLEFFEKSEEQKIFRRHSAKLRADALVPVRSIIMQAARDVSARAQE